MARSGWWPPRLLRPLVPLAVPLLTLAFAAAAAFSTLLPLRQSAVGPDYHLQEMLRMRPIVDGQNVLFLGRDNFVSWELIGSEVYAPITNHYDVEEITFALPRDRPERQVRLGQPPALRHEQVQLGGHDERGDAEPGAGRFLAPAPHPRLHPLAPRPSGRPAPHPVRADQPRRAARLQRPRRVEAEQARRHRDGLHGPAGGRPGLAPEPRAHPVEARPAAPLPDPRAAGTSRSSTRAPRPCTSRPAAARWRRPSTRPCAPTCSSAGPRRTTRSERSR